MTDGVQTVMTVGKLKRLLNHIPDDIAVVVPEGNSEFRSISFTIDKATDSSEDGTKFSLQLNSEDQSKVIDVLIIT